MRRIDYSGLRYLVCDRVRRMPGKICCLRNWLGRRASLSRLRRHLSARLNPEEFKTGMLWLYRKGAIRLARKRGTRTIVVLLLRVPAEVDAKAGKTTLRKRKPRPPSRWFLEHRREFDERDGYLNEGEDTDDEPCQRPVPGDALFR
jgi:hypothetical protein